MKRFLLRALPWVLALPAAVWAVLRLAGWDTRYPVAQLMAFTPYVAAGSLVPLAVLLVWRRWAAAALAAVTALALAVVVLPRWFADDDPMAGAAGVPLRVMSANVLVGSADAAELVSLVRSHRVDVLALQEVTPDYLAAADAAGMRDELPYRVDYSVPGVEGSALLSRFPLRDDGMRVNPGGFRQARAEVAVPGGGGVLIESAHPLAPWADFVMPLWERGFQGQPRATPDGPVRVLLGDFNATLDHHLLRDLIDSGYRDAADVLGRGLAGTWGPYDGDSIPPVTLDRVLADRRVGVKDFQVLELPDSDHRPVYAELVLP
ncbi:endonuclease/exonuclease/phosphatase family protein [Catellatospora vulcania]|uniref:endonuclease/exonuclease/phosphatase family protein n=1 Tax=Catellatospora vulcania TaxID=1460450 RepID=UPI0012D488CA|nr:endonuclease/exonuclease/phosphatase family protein [Catellatospora vulcania]